MVNTNKLKGLIASEGLTHYEFAEKIGLSAGGFHKKLHNINDFKSSEIEKISEFFNITDAVEKNKIFFARNEELKSSNQ